MGLLLGVSVLSSLLCLSALPLPRLELYAFPTNVVARFAPALLALPVSARWVFGAVRTWEVTADGRFAASAGAAKGAVDGGALAGVCLVSSRVSKAWCKAVSERGGRRALLFNLFLKIGEESSASLSLG